ncbi:MAG: hypothetical protein EOO74_06990 [Myxococcales bacterium]|nr:MAG: hypothetical protein EOO74_06990 [Myxococcales bacterium]
MTSFRAVLVAFALAIPALVSAAPAAQSTTAAHPPRAEVWQVPQAAYKQNPTNPLAHRVWGVYEGPQDQVWRPYQAATGAKKTLLGKIALRPRTKWYGGWVGDSEIRTTVRRYIESSQKGDRTRLVQMAIFRMKPWEHDACKRPSTVKERESYKTWILNLRAGIATTPTLIVMQPDGPFLFCAKDRKVKGRLLTWATRALSSLPNTSVYIDAGAADWCENGKGNKPARCAQILKETGIRYARGFALDSTHYTGPADNVRHGARIIANLKRSGYGTKHFIIDTAKSGRPMWWSQVIPATKGGKKDNARVCTTTAMQRCVTLGIPPTTRVASTEWGLPKDVRAVAARYVDAFVWFGRPWLYNQADPYQESRALPMTRTTPWQAPKVDLP